MNTTILGGIAGAGLATGPTIVIDTFRAFTTAAVAHHRGVGRHILVEAVDEARNLARLVADPVLCGEDRGAKPDGFDLGNSPMEMTRYAIAGRTLIQRTSAGTRCVVAALRNGAGPVYPTALVTASATARAVADQAMITIVTSGTHGTLDAPEDNATAQFVVDAINGCGDPCAVRAGVLSSSTAQTLKTAPWADPADLDVCSDVDRFSFALAAHLHSDGFAEVERIT